MRKIICAVAIAAALGACAYKPQPVAAPALDVVTSFSNKVPGKWLLYVDASAFDTIIRPSEFQCSAHTYPVELSSAFPRSVRETLANVVSDIEMLDAPIPADQVGTRGARGLIVVRATGIDSSFRSVPGFWSANIVTDVAMTAAVTVDGRRQRLFGKTMDGRGKGDAPQGFACSGGADSLKTALSKAMQELLREMGEEIGNSERVRGG